VFHQPALYQGTTLQLAEKCQRSSKKRQGTTSVVPQTQQNESRALAPEGRLKDSQHLVLKQLLRKSMVIRT
jgi:hypothetical protein